MRESVMMNICEKDSTILPTVICIIDIDVECSTAKSAIMNNIMEMM